MRIKVKALVTGTHTLSGLYLEAGQEYELEEEQFGGQIMERVDPESGIQNSEFKIETKEDETL